MGFTSKMYKTITGTETTNIIIKKSNFIASCFYVRDEEEAKSVLADVCKEHYKATHNCYAYRIHGDYIIEKSSDNGEPSGTAGMPILECIRGAEIENILVVVTRYFGGIKLGTGGLVRAYGGATKEVLAIADVVEIVDYVELDLTVAYTQVGKVEYYLNNEEIFIKDTLYSDDVSYKLVILKDLISKFEKDITELLSGSASIKKGEEVRGYLSSNELVAI